MNVTIQSSMLWILRYLKATYCMSTKIICKFLETQAHLKVLLLTENSEFFKPTTTY